MVCLIVKWIPKFRTLFFLSRYFDGPHVKPILSLKLAQRVQHYKEVMEATAGAIVVAMVIVIIIIIIKIIMILIKIGIIK